MGRTGLQKQMYGFIQEQLNEHIEAIDNQLSSLYIKTSRLWDFCMSKHIIATDQATIFNMF